MKRARAVFSDAFHLTPEDSEGGLALSVSFGGSSPSSGLGPGDGRGGGKQPPSNDPKTTVPPAADPPAGGAGQGPLDMLARNLQRIPLDQDARLEVDMAFLQRPTLERKKASETPSNLREAMKQAGGAPRPAATGVRREFHLKATSPEDQRAQVQKVLDELRDVLKAAPPDAEVRMGMRLNYVARSAAPKVAPEGSPSAGSADSKARVSYQPRQVGNDMNLWVMGTGWMALVEETLPEPGEDPKGPDDADWWVSTGLGYAALGQAKPALDAFEKAIRLDKTHELAWLGRAVALVESGREAEAKESLERVLQLQPKNKAARDGLKWLRQEPPAAKKGARLP
ncbi:MAG: tetratricopeptide repeat protein [Elusimicrobia bacterium]|nr:tetratricopeptide repeat protein [Elusimicrobiota bacterium]